ncbi:MAG: TlpA family protein disulfide reductase [Armatimonadota bacterium]
MRSHPVVMVGIALMLACSMALAQEACDYTAVGKTMESAAAQDDWETAYTHAQQIVDAQPEDLSTLSADHQYWVGLAHAYLMARAFEMAEEGLEGERATTAAEMAAMVHSPAVENVRTISHGEEVELTDYVVPGKTVLFDFYSRYCPPCVRIAPMIERVAETRDDVVLVKVDINRPDVQGIDWQSPVARQYDLRGIPHFMIYGPDGTLQAEGGEARTMVNNWIGELEG